MLHQPSPFHVCPWRSFHGRDLWEVAREEFGASFNAAMACDGRFVMDVLVRDHGNVFRSLASMVDVGGGAARAIAAALPHDATIPPGELGVVEFVAGDMFEHVPKADAVLKVRQPRPASLSFRHIYSASETEQ
jgi:hypothetical protein